MDDLATWLRAQLDEDERAAQSARHGGRGEWRQVDAEREHGRIEDDRGEVVTYDEGSPTEGQAEHIARHDPARVLREVEATRRILDAHEHYRGDHLITGNTVIDEETGKFGCSICSFDRDYGILPDGWCATVRLLALPYADRAGYRDEWRP